MIYGYARVSTDGQARDGNGLEAQETALKAAGAERIYFDHFTGMKQSRPQLDQLMSELSDGDTLVVTKLDRVARSVVHGNNIITSLMERNVRVNVLNLGVMDNTPNGKLIRNVFLAFAEFERDMIVQRTAEGKSIAKMKPDFREGRPKADTQGFEKLARKQKDGHLTVQQCCKELGVSRATWYNRVRELTS